jgi:4'-phosphopantetheinyl transferase
VFAIMADAGYSSRFDSREVQIWSVRLNGNAAALARYHSYLSSAEQSRVDQFKFEHLKRSHTFSRGVLRLLLAFYLDLLPGSIEFAYGPKGKPAVRRTTPLRFNVSHSGDVAVYAFTLDCDLGVDVEKLRALADLESISARFFCAAEASELLSLPPDNRPVAFFRCWTRKEAYIKAIGDGLSMPLDRFQVTLLPEDSARFVHIGHDEKTAQNWALHHLDFGPPYVGALAYQDRPRPIKQHALIGAEELLTNLGG